MTSNLQNYRSRNQQHFEGERRINENTNSNAQNFQLSSLYFCSDGILSKIDGFFTAIFISPTNGHPATGELYLRPIRYIDAQTYAKLQSYKFSGKEGGGIKEIVSFDQVRQCSKLLEIKIVKIFGEGEGGLKKWFLPIRYVNAQNYAKLKSYKFSAKKGGKG